MSTKVVMIGSGTPDADPYRAGPCVAVIVDETAYLVDFGSNIIRRTAKMHRLGIKCLQAKYLQYGFLTHLHLDHTLGYPDLMLTPWILGRQEPLKVFGPRGLQHMTDRLREAYEVEINDRLEGFTKMDPAGGTAVVTEIEDGFVYEDERVKVEAIQVNHGTLEQSFAFKFTSADKVVVISGDTTFSPKLIEAAKGCDILLHEAYYSRGLEERPKKWADYHASMHTSALDLGRVANESEAKMLVIYHPIYLLGQNGPNLPNLEEVMKERENHIVEDVAQSYKGKIVFAKDDDIYE